MSIARAFTTRRARQPLELGGDSSEGVPQRSKTTRIFGGHSHSHQPSIRDKISAPVALTHTTNMLSYDAPDIHPQAESASAAHAPVTPPTVSPSLSGKSDDESESGFTAASTPPTSPGSPFSSQKRVLSPGPNHLSCYFMPPKQAVVSEQIYQSNSNAIAAPSVAPSVAFPASHAPAIPQRAPSHTKKSYDLARNHSVSRLSEQSARSLSSKGSFNFSSRSSSSSTSTSVTSHGSHISTSVKSTSFQSPASALSSPASLTALSRKNYTESHPFGPELAKVSELVEEFGKDEGVTPAPLKTGPAAATHTNPIIDREERELILKGLRKFSAEEYLSDIQELMSSFFIEAPRPLATVWI